MTSTQVPYLPRYLASGLGHAPGRSVVCGIDQPRKKKRKQEKGSPGGRDEWGHLFPSSEIKFNEGGGANGTKYRWPAWTSDYAEGERRRVSGQGMGRVDTYYSLSE